MKRLVFLLLVFMFVFQTAFAEKKEWVDKNFDFKKANTILIQYNYLPHPDGISENETYDIFFEKMFKIYDKLRIQNYKFYNQYNVAQILQKEQNIDIIKLYESDFEKANSIYQNWIKENVDIFIKVDTLAYDTGSQYFEGYWLNMPTTNTSYVNTPDGSATITSYGTTQQYVRGGNVPVAYCCVRFVAYDTTTGESVWAKLDDRAKANQTVLDNTTPKDMYKRIVNNWVSSLESKLDRE